MALTFAATTGIVDLRSDGVMFFAVEGSQAIMFIVARRALQRLEPSAGTLTGDALLQAFARHRAAVEAAALKALAGSPEPDPSSGAYLVDIRHF